MLRRRWSLEAKARIIEETLLPGMNVSAVARAHGLSPQQLFAWRRKAIRSGRCTLLPARARRGRQSFAGWKWRARQRFGGGLEIIIGGTTIRVDDAVAAGLLIEAIRAVRAA